MLTKIPQDMLSDLMACAEKVRKHRNVQIFSHYDADGISSAGIVSIALDRAGIRNTVWTFTTLSDSEMQKVREQPFECMVMTDLGTSYLPEISALGRDCVVLDHHRLPAAYNAGMHPGVSFANCEKSGISGTKDACAATMAYLFALCLDRRNKDLVEIALGGMFGDNQLYGGASGLNRIVIDEAVKDGFVKEYTSVMPAGSVSDYLMIGTTPYLKGISGNREAIARFLSEGGFRSDLCLGIAPSEESSRFATYVSDYMDRNMPDNCAGETEITRYWLRDHELDAEMFSLMIDSCGRSFMKGLGLLVCRKKYYGDSMFAVRGFRAPLMKLIQEVQDGLLRKEENFYWFEHRYEGIGGIACSALSKYIYGRKYPLVSLNTNGRSISLSSRCQRCLCDEGVDLNMAMRAATNPLGGSGGGHINAAGGAIDFSAKEEFIRNLDRIIGEQKSTMKEF